MCAKELLNRLMGLTDISAAAHEDDGLTAPLRTRSGVIAGHCPRLGHRQIPFKSVLNSPRG